MTNKKSSSSGNYEVGYGKTPKHSRFKKGQSGNRKGRTKGAVNKVSEDSVLTLVAREAYRDVTVNDGTQIMKLPVILVSIRSLMQKAAKGDIRAVHKALELLEKVEAKGASDKAMLANQANQSFEEFLKTLSSEDLGEIRANLKKATSIKQFSQEAIRQAQRAERKRLADLDQSK